MTKMAQRVWQASVGPRSRLEGREVSLYQKNAAVAEGLIRAAQSVYHGLEASRDSCAPPLAVRERGLPHPAQHDGGQDPYVRINVIAQHGYADTMRHGLVPARRQLEQRALAQTSIAMLQLSDNTLRWHSQDVIQEIESDLSAAWRDEESCL